VTGDVHDRDDVAIALGRLDIDDTLAARGA
jgi:hypothetical protein